MEAKILLRNIITDIEEPFQQHTRIGPEYQAIIPELLLNYACSARKSFRFCETLLWCPDNKLSHNQLSEYLLITAQNGYSEESAMYFLHWHCYDTLKAIDDLPNYVPYTNIWSRNELKNYLKIIISNKSGKDFSLLRSYFPAHDMHEISSIYYRIIAPFKFQNKKCFNMERRMKIFLTKALKLKLIQDVKMKRNQTSPFSSMPFNLYQRQGLGRSKDFIENLFDLHLSTHLGTEEAKRLKHMLNLDRVMIIDELKMGNSPERNRNSNVLLFKKPMRTRYVHSQFENFINGECSVRRNNESNLKKMDELIEFERKETETVSRELAVLSDDVKPPYGLPRITYRWNKLELALILISIKRLGVDFNFIARILGTKSESFVRDFYNKWFLEYDFRKLIPQQINSTSDPNLEMPKISLKSKTKTMKRLAQSTSYNTQAKSKFYVEHDSDFLLPRLQRHSKRQIIPPRRHSP